MKILLYYAPNTCALAPYVTLTEANASFEAKPLNFRKSEHRLPAYLRLNPMHKVPLLMIDGEPRHPDMDRAQFPAGEAAAIRPVAGAQGDLDPVVVLVQYTSLSVAPQRPVESL
jgi:hypothetical protein